MRLYTYRILINKEPEGGFTVSVPTLLGCMTFGDSTEEAIGNAKEAISLYLGSLVEDGEQIPTEENTFEYSVSISA